MSSVPSATPKATKNPFAGTSHLAEVILVELLIIKVIAALAISGLAIRVFLREAAAIAAGFRRLRR